MGNKYKRNKSSIKKLKVGDIIKNSNNVSGKITKIKVVEYKGGKNVYNFEVKDSHNYFVGNNEYLVHNNCSYGNMLLK